MVKEGVKMSKDECIEILNAANEQGCDFACDIIIFNDKKYYVEIINGLVMPL